MPRKLLPAVICDIKVYSTCAGSRRFISHKTIEWQHTIGLFKVRAKIVYTDFSTLCCLIFTHLQQIWYRWKATLKRNILTGKNAEKMKLKRKKVKKKICNFVNITVKGKIFISVESSGLADLKYVICFPSDRSILRKIRLFDTWLEYSSYSCVTQKQGVLKYSNTSTVDIMDYNSIIPVTRVKCRTT